MCAEKLSNPVESQVRNALLGLERTVVSALDGQFVAQLAAAATAVREALQRGNKLLTCGNGGSAAEAMHLAEELVGRYKTNRAPQAAVCLCSDSTAISCIANDFGFEHIFDRQVEALGRERDLLIAFTSSGKSQNVNLAIRAARQRGMLTIAITGILGGESAELADMHVAAPSEDSARVQELHTLVVHSICENCEDLT